MQKKRFNKKKIMGILKTYHAKQRQIERNVTDLQLIKILQHGEYEERSEHEVIIRLDGYHLYLDYNLEKIITVTAPEKQVSTPKIVSSQAGNKLKDTIKEKEAKIESDEQESMTFEDYMNNKFK
ncbi:hypothetical protein A9Q84_13835 [Halobacteriovorax marinus]|uniref:Uncharacterized protein n=1 Tax=Halobacteriovorax marinus TaxID=97084 RepID=A0A1Y5FD65_9BACT|nr:hypothetical protein A9Q84_13835 [Halobacteriovorax marinus]